MKLEDKLAHFSKFCITDARNRADKMLEDYQAALDKSFEEYKHDEERRAAMQLSSEADTIKREGNRRISIEQTALKKQIGTEHEKLKEAIFSELKAKLKDFMSTRAYYEMLKNQIREVLDFAGTDEAQIYIDPKDGGWLRELVSEYGSSIKLNDTGFMGGTRAVISAKNIFIDNSFETKLSDARENLKLELGGTF